MIDRYARDIAAEALRDFMEGSITNDEFERRFPNSKEDGALWAIRSQLWFCYSDTCVHTLSGKHALTKSARALYERCFLFLKSNREFQWPKPEYRIRYGVLRLLGLGRILKRRENQQMSIGDKEVWPFLKRAEYEESANAVGSQGQ